MFINSYSFGLQGVYYGTQAAYTAAVANVTKLIGVNPNYSSVQTMDCKSTSRADSFSCTGPGITRLGPLEIFSYTRTGPEYPVIPKMFSYSSNVFEKKS